jgi:hypothetical protein
MLKEENYLNSDLRINRDEIDLLIRDKYHVGGEKLEHFKCMRKELDNSILREEESKNGVKIDERGSSSPSLALN